MIVTVDATVDAIIEFHVPGPETEYEVLETRYGDYSIVAINGNKQTEIDVYLFRHIAEQKCDEYRELGV